LSRNFPFYDGKETTTKRATDFQIRLSEKLGHVGAKFEEREGDAQVATSRLFSGLQQVENQLIEQFLEYCTKSGATVDFSEIYSKPFGKPYEHWKFLTKKLTQFH